MSRTENARRMRQRVNAGLMGAIASGAVEAENAQSMAEKWHPSRSYAVGEVCVHGGTLYKCIQAHTSQGGWQPGNVPALFAVLGDAGDNSSDIASVSKWVQPTGAQDAYSIGDIVKHKGKNWVSTVDANVWEPGVYGWEVQA